MALDPAARRLALQKTAFEVAWRINQGMPVTATALVTTVLLAMQGAALTFGQIRLGLADGMDYLESRSVPRTASALALSGAGAVRATLDALVSGGVVSYVAEGRDPVWLIGPEHQLAATFYRNSLIHFLLDTALCELAVLRRPGRRHRSGRGVLGRDRQAPRPAEVRVLLPRTRRAPARGSGGDDPARSVVGIAACVPGPRRRTGCWPGCGRWSPTSSCGRSSRRTGSSPTCWRTTTRWFPILEVVRRALGLGRQYVAQHRLRSSESVSALLFQTALQLARNRGLLEPGPDLAERRAAFLAELRDLVRRLDQIENLAIRRYIRDTVNAMPAD